MAKRLQRLSPPTRADFDAVLWLGRADDGTWANEAANWVGFRGPEDWPSARYPLGPNERARLAAWLDLETRLLQASLRRDAERRGVPRAPLPRRTRPDYPTPETFTGRSSSDGVLTAAYLMGEPSAVRLAQLAAALAIRDGASQFDAFTDTFLPGWRSYRQDAEKQVRSAERGGPFALRAEIELLAPSTDRNDDQGAETYEEALGRLTGGTCDFAPGLLARMAYNALPASLRHADHEGAPLTGARKVARHRARRAFTRAANPYLAALDSWRGAAKEIGLGPDVYVYRKPTLVRRSKPKPAQAAQEKDWSRRGMAKANLEASRAEADVRAMFAGALPYS